MGQVSVNPGGDRDDNAWGRRIFRRPHRVKSRSVVAFRRPDLVRKLGLIGQFVTLEGARPEYLALLAGMTPEAFPPMLRQLYAAVSPDGPDHFGVVLDKLLPLWRSDPGCHLHYSRGSRIAR